MRIWTSLVPEDVGELRAASASVLIGVTSAPIRSAA